MQDAWLHEYGAIFSATHWRKVFGIETHHSMLLVYPVLYALVSVLSCPGRTMASIEQWYSRRSMAPETQTVKRALHNPFTDCPIGTVIQLGDNMLTKYQMIKFIDFCEVWFLPESVARVAAIVGDHRCHTPRH
ncbi:hypothetical protein TNCV_795371 [Trichonephila clavipes]|nr:hypothetical protein TNCV_795371 [Trichonephila clavipes]